MRSGDRRPGRPYSSSLFHLITARGLEQLGTSDKHSEHHQMLLHPHVLIYSRMSMISGSSRRPRDGPIPAAWPRAVTYLPRDPRGRGWRDMGCVEACTGRVYRLTITFWLEALFMGCLFRVGFRKKMECLGSREGPNRLLNQRFVRWHTEKQVLST